MATLTTSGRAGLAASVKDRNIYIGIGSGSASWDGGNTPAESTSSTALTTAVGYRLTSQKDFVVADAAGSISLPSGRFEISASQTNQLYLRFTLDFSDADTDTIRETAVFLDAVPDATLPAGQVFFTPSDMTGIGSLYLIEHVPAIIRTSATRETFEFVLTF